MLVRFIAWGRISSSVGEFQPVSIFEVEYGKRKDGKLDASTQFALDEVMKDVERGHAEKVSIEVVKTSKQIIGG